jgi:multidrug efflux system membrane fusion protein
VKLLAVKRSAPVRFYPTIWLLILALTPLLVVSSCSRAPEGAAPDAAAGKGKAGRGRGDTAVPVTTTRAQEMAVPVYLQAVGNVEAESTVDVRPQVTGPLLSVHFTEGQDVEKGQLLFTIDPRPFELALRQAETQLAKDSGQSKTAENQRARYASLSKSGLVSQEQFDTVSAQANSLQGTLAADQVQIDNAKMQLQYTKILAPMSGRTGALQVHPGSQVRTADAAPMVVINQIRPVRVTFSVPASHLPAIRSGQARGALATEAFASGDGADTASSGKLSFIDNAVDPTTSGIKLKATFPNNDRKLWPGEFVQVRLRVSIDSNVIVVPASAVQNGPKGQYVYIVADGTAALRPVKVSRSEGHNVVISEGIRPGEEVVTDGQLRLTPGVKVAIKPAIGGAS